MARSLPDDAFVPLKDYISQSLLDGRTIEADENLLLSGLLDSLGVMSLVTFIEQQFQIAVPFEDVTIENFASLTTMTAYIRASEQTHE